MIGSFRNACVFSSVFNLTFRISSYSPRYACLVVKLLSWGSMLVAGLLLFYVLKVLVGSGGNQTSMSSTSLIQVVNTTMLLLFKDTIEIWQHFSCNAWSCYFTTTFLLILTYSTHNTVNSVCCRSCFLLWYLWWYFGSRTVLSHELFVIKQKSPKCINQKKISQPTFFAERRARSLLLLRLM